MKAPNYNFCMNQGDDFALTLTIKGDNGVPFDLTGYSFASQARETIASPTPAFAFDFFIPPQVDTEVGKVVMRISNANSAAIALGGLEQKDFIYDVEMTDANSLVSKIMRGTVTVVAEVTK